MTSQDFLAWMQQTEHRFAADIVRSLGVSRNIAQRWVADAQAGQDIDIKPATALAMSAIVAKLKPWGSKE
ncbi:hypothetical protein [Falsirhodobacter halotolerans]|uniref:hypothetical protein n=1 Tax=Falsirhodobacter halotolerans TaxID=1146892 RepID=UPI001FD162BD|nr:hypothetical protein [Falsirhodobacter halotolerans]MCJ8138454.1 hypothetical protein [Falsirhodobacter halotolerans]